MDTSFDYDDLRIYLWVCWLRLRVSCEFEVWAAGGHEADMTPEMVAGLVVIEAALEVPMMEVAA